MAKAARKPVVLAVPQTWYRIGSHLGEIREVPYVVRYTAASAWALDDYPRTNRECRYVRTEIFPTRAEAHAALVVAMRAIRDQLQATVGAARQVLDQHEGRLRAVEAEAAVIASGAAYCLCHACRKVVVLDSDLTHDGFCSAACRDEAGAECRACGGALDDDGHCTDPECSLAIDLDQKNHEEPP